MPINGKEYKIEPRAILSSANLSGANLSGANLCGAILSRANLSGAKINEDVIKNLVTRLTRMNDEYEFIAFRLEDNSVRIKAGCRWMTTGEYRLHVVSEYPNTPKATETLQILDFIDLRDKETRE